MAEQELARPAAEINIGKVVQSVEPNFHIVECFDRDHNACVITGVCALKGALHAATRALFDELERHTLADVVANQQPLRFSLQMKPGG